MIKNFINICCDISADNNFCSFGVIGNNCADSEKSAYGVNEKCECGEKRRKSLKNKIKHKNHPFFKSSKTAF